MDLEFDQPLAKDQGEEDDLDADFGDSQDSEESNVDGKDRFKYYLSKVFHEQIFLQLINSIRIATKIVHKLNKAIFISNVNIFFKDS